MWVLCLIFVFVTGECFGCLVGTVLRAVLKPPVVNGTFATPSFRFGTIILALVSVAWSWHYFSSDNYMLMFVILLGIGTLTGIWVGYQSSARIDSPSPFKCAENVTASGVTKPESASPVSPPHRSALVPFLILFGVLAAACYGVRYLGPGKPDENTKALRDFFVVHHYAFCMAFGAIFFPFLQIYAIGWKKFRHSNHPIQALIFTSILGVLIGLALGWVAGH